jgi:hypothetical protein
MTANQHFERIFVGSDSALNNAMNRLMFVAGFEAALNEIMDRSKNGTFSAYNMALAMYSESVIEDVQRLKAKNAETTNNEKCV